MKSKQVNTTPKTFVLVFDAGEEVMKGIEIFCATMNVNAASFTAIGAFSSAEIGFFELSKQDYKKIAVAEQTEALSLIGNITQYKQQLKVHAHAVLGRSDGTTCGGHLLSGIVTPTLEVVITELPTHLHREMNEQFGIPLIRL